MCFVCVIQYDSKKDAYGAARVRHRHISMSQSCVVRIYAACMHINIVSILADELPSGARCDGTDAKNWKTLDGAVRDTCVHTAGTHRGTRTERAVSIYKIRF